MLHLALPRGLVLYQVSVQLCCVVGLLSCQAQYLLYEFVQHLAVCADLGFGLLGFSFVATGIFCWRSVIT